LKSYCQPVLQARLAVFSAMVVFPLDFSPSLSFLPELIRFHIRVKHPDPEERISGFNETGLFSKLAAVSVRGYRQNRGRKSYQIRCEAISRVKCRRPL
jgi:hypothetical protein